MDYSYLCDFSMYTIVLENLKIDKEYQYRIIYGYGNIIKSIINNSTKFHGKKNKLIKIKYDYDIVCIYDGIESIYYLKKLFSEDENNIVKITKLF